MPITDSQKTDYLWKKTIFGVTETDIDGKEAPNESIASPLQLFGHTIYLESGDIPTPAPAVTGGVVRVYSGVTAIECVSDPSVAGNKTWIAVTDVGQPIDNTNRIIDWIPPTVDPSYLVKVYDEDPTTTGTLLNPLVPNFEWTYDYIAGVLHFPNGAPASILGGAPIFIEGFQYIGLVGLASSPTSTNNQTFNITTAPLLAGQFEEFIFSTGPVAMIVNTIVDKPSTVEAHAFPARIDTNPYKFIGITGKLSDDGSFVQGSQTFFGPRYAFISSQESPFEDTFWRITNNGSTTEEITLTVNITAF